jgi:sensor domain CHASE-containing protein
MKIRAKILLILGTILIVFIPLLLIATRFIVFESYLELEEDEAIEHVLWTDKVIVNDLDLLSHSAADWAYWDDTYDFVDDLNEAYIEDNLANETLANLNINMMVFVNMAGDVVYGKYIDIETGEDASPPNLDAIINPNSPALNLPDESSDATGFISTSDTVLEFASRSILTDDAQHVLRLRYGGSVPRTTIAERLGMSEAGVKSIIVRARRRLRECVERRLASIGGTP